MLKRGVTDSYPFVGGAQAEFKLTDSLTGQILAAGVDRRIGGGNISTAAQWEWGDAENVMKAWSKLAADRFGLDQGHGEAGLNRSTGERQGHIPHAVMEGAKMRSILKICSTLLALIAGAALLAAPAPAQTGKKPNILFIMGDDVGWFNVGAYHRGIMSGKTPNLDKLAAQGMLFTDYYAEASCTAGRANFITGEIPLRTGLTTVGQAGADVGMPAKACTLATALKAQGYATGQFGKNHLGDLNKFLPTRARLRRVLRLPVSPRRDVRPVLVLVPDRPGLLRQVRPAQPGALLGDRHGRRRPRCRAGARSASRRSSTKARCRRSRTCPTCPTCTTCRS